MKRFFRKVKDLQQHAADFKEYMEKLPPKVAEIRQAVHMTTGQLQQLRADVHSSVSNLKADNEDRLMVALQEINGGEEVFRQAGYELSGVDMEISPVHRLVVHLDKLADIHESSQRLLLTANQKNPTIHALLSSLIQADKMSQQIKLSNLVYRKVVVHVGPVPSVRLCWQAEEVFEEEAAGESASLPTASAPEPPPSSAPQSLLGESSFFGQRYSKTSTQPSPSQSPQTTNDSSPPTSSPSKDQPPGPATAQVSKDDWRKDALARFKVMPSISKYK